MDKPTKEDALLGLLLKKQQEMVKDVKVRRNLGHVTMTFRILSFTEE